jgi:ribosomal protein S18 acetylase RimI-like enzyme
LDGGKEMPSVIVREIRVRAMEPKDVEEVVRLHSLAFPDYFLTHMGHNFLKRLYTCFLERPSFPFVALERDVVVGFVVGVIGTEELFRRFYRSNLAFVIRTATVRVLCDSVVRAGLLQRFRHVKMAVSSLFPLSRQGCVRDGQRSRTLEDAAVPDRTADALSQAVAPDCRGRGIPGMYMTALFEALEREGIREIRGWVLRDNIPARRSLEKGGWLLISDDESGCEYSRPIISRVCPLPTATPSARSQPSAEPEHGS